MRDQRLCSTAACKHSPAPHQGARSGAVPATVGTGTTGLQLSADVSQKMSFAPQFEITNSITAELRKIERARGFRDAAKLSEDWIAGMQKRALVLEAYYTTHRPHGAHKILPAATVTSCDRLL
jgi:hypothetical protein